jgi:ABC-type multidrug transport system fused ATPase/permease subunit
VGISGSDKSTIVHLLERFYDVSDGEIFIDGVNIKEYDIKELRKVIGYVPQEPVLFNASIEENVKYGYLEAKREEVESGCSIANASDFILKDEYALPEGKSEVLGSNER